MDKRIMHVVAGDISGLVLDVISGSFNGLATGATYLATINGTQAQTYSQFFGAADTQFNFEPLMVRLKVDVASGVISVPIISIGTNSPNYNNIISSVTLTGLSVLGTFSMLMPSAAVKASFGQDIYVNVTSAGVGTTLSMSADIIGTFQP